MNKTCFIFLLALCFFCERAIAQPVILSITNDLDKPAGDHPWINLQTVVNGTANSGTKYSSTDSVNAYGLGYKGTFPQSCQNKNLQVRISEYLRVSKTGTSVFIVISVSAGDSVITWQSINAGSGLNAANTWTRKEDVFEIPASITGNLYTFSVYLWNSDGKAVADMDDFRIDFLELNTPSFLPKEYLYTNEKDGWQKMTGDDPFRFLYNKFSGNITILSKEGDTLVHSLALYSEWADKKEKDVQNEWTYRFNLRKDSITEEGVYYLLSAKNKISENTISILASREGSLSFQTQTIFNSQVILARHTLTVRYTLPVDEVYKKSTLTDTTNFINEYWLGKEGFALSDGKQSMVLYRPASVSSIQLDKKNNLAFINLDYSADHPFLHFPLMKKSEGKFEDRSRSVYANGDSIRGEFKFNVFKSPVKIARLMANPNGYRASFVWTEHADYTNLRTHKAVYFGNENCNRLEDATGGFLKYSIPVTKSIFYSNPDKVDNSDKAGFMKGPVACYKETEGFADFIKMLHEYGNEICLHTPDHFTSDRKLLAEALEKTRREFTSSTWIDHGYDNSARSNRENIMCDGTDQNSKWYSADQWKNFGVKYFWNSFYEDSGLVSDYAFNSFFSVPYSGWGESFPVPLYWRHKTRTGDFIHWRTVNTLDPVDGSLWSYYFNDLRLNEIVNNRENVIIHCYPARVDSTNGFYSLENGVLKSNVEFNNALKKLSDFRQQDKIRLTTVQGLLDHLTAIEKVEVDVRGNGKIIVRNTGNELIRGVSFSSYSVEVVPDGNKEIAQRNESGELLFWFDLLPGETVVFTLK